MRVLLTDSDYLTIRAYVEFMNMLADEIARGKTVEELFDPARLGERRYTGHLSILVAETQKRSIGHRNENLTGVLDKRIFEADVEAEAAFAAACAAQDAAKCPALAEKRAAAAAAADKKQSVRVDNARKCGESAAAAAEAATRAREEAAAAAREAAACREWGVGGVRPSEKAAIDAAEADECAAAAAACAGEALAQVTRTRHVDHVCLSRATVVTLTQKSLCRSHAPDVSLSWLWRR